MAREFFCAYHSYLDSLESLDDAERGRLFTACLLFSKTGEAPELPGNERFVFPFLRSQIQRDRESYGEFCEKQRERVNRRWHGENTGGIPAYTKEKEKEKEREKEKEKEKKKREEPDVSSHTSAPLSEGQDKTPAEAPAPPEPEYVPMPPEVHRRIEEMRRRVALEKVRRGPSADVSGLIAQMVMQPLPESPPQAPAPAEDASGKAPPQSQRSQRRKRQSSARSSN